MYPTVHCLRMENVAESKNLCTCPCLLQSIINSGHTSFSLQSPSVSDGNIIVLLTD